MEDNQTLFSLSIDPLTKAHLNDIAKWARFLGILAMVILFLALIFTILNATVLNNAMGMSLSLNGQPKDELSNSIRVSMVVGAIIMTGVAFIPLFFLLQFAGNMKKALAANDQDNLNEAFLNLKKYFRFLGIIIIIVIAMYILVFALAIISGTV